MPQNGDTSRFTEAMLNARRVDLNLLFAKSAPEGMPLPTMKEDLKNFLLKNN